MAPPKSKKKDANDYVEESIERERPVAHLIGRRGAACGITVPRGVRNPRRGDPHCEDCANAAGSYIVSDDGMIMHYPYR
jgi:hypothetical protein